jgi:ATP-binding cassette subfamily B protein
MSESTDPRHRPKAASAKPLRALKPFLAPYKGLVMLAIVFLLLASVAMLSLPIAARHLVDNGFANSDIGAVNQYFAGFFVIAVLFGIFAALRFYFVTWLGERVVADLRNAVYRRVIHMDPTFFEITRTGEVLSRITADTTLVQNIAGSTLSIALRSLINLFGGLALLAFTSFKLTVFIFLGIPMVLVPLIYLGRRIRGLSRTAQNAVADTSGVAGETLNAIQTVQAYTLEELQIKRFGDAVAQSFRAGMRRIRMRSILTAMGFVLVFGAITVILWLGSRAVITGDMSMGQLAQFLLYSMLVGGSAAALSEQWGSIQMGAGAMERLSELLETFPAIVPPAQPRNLGARAEGRIRFDNVDFSYPSRPDDLALNGINLDIRPGEQVAIVGPSGAGKSTTFQLLLRFYDPRAGRIIIDNEDLAGLDPVELRSHIALVPQETVLFGETARENIRLGRPGASDAEVEQAAIAAYAHDFIVELPEGYDTFLGERGLRLSGGQRQRVAIARAILKDPPILLLDEATSSLDSESEQLVQGALETLMESRTTIVIAHRLSTVQKADRILVMDQGQVIASGTHQELLGSSALYARLAALQFGETTT